MEYVADILILVTLANRAPRDLNRPPMGLMSVSGTPTVIRITRSSRHCAAAFVITDDGKHMQTSTTIFDSTTHQALETKATLSAVAYR